MELPRGILKTVGESERACGGETVDPQVRACSGIRWSSKFSRVRVGALPRVALLRGARLVRDAAGVLR